MRGIGLAALIGSGWQMKVLNPPAPRLRLNRLQQWSAAQDRYDAFHIVGEHIINQYVSKRTFLDMAMRI